MRQFINREAILGIVIAIRDTTRGWIFDGEFMSN